MMLYKVATRSIISKEKVTEYYENNYHKMIDYMKGKQIMTVQMVPGPVIRKQESGKPIYITSFDPEDKDNPNNLFYYTNRHHVDFHIIHGPTTDIIPIDIDPVNVPHHKVMPVVRAVARAVKPMSKNIEVFHTGGRGYHIIAKLDNPMNTRLAKRIVDQRIKPVLKAFNYTTDRPPKRGEIRIDTSTFHPGGSIRVPYSINYKTGMPSRKIEIA